MCHRLCGYRFDVERQNLHGIYSTLLHPRPTLPLAAKQPQNAIYFLCAPNRELAEASPYFEAFKRHNREVIFVYNAIDDFVMNNLRTYHGRCDGVCYRMHELDFDAWGPLFFVRRRTMHDANTSAPHRH